MTEERTDEDIRAGEPEVRPGRTTAELMHIIDALYAELPVDVVIQLAGEQPTIIDACKAIHDEINHPETG